MRKKFAEDARSLLKKLKSSGKTNMDKKTDKNRDNKVSRFGMNKNSIKKSFKNNLFCSLAKDKYTATALDNFKALSIAVRERLVKRWLITQQRYHRKKEKRVYYLSMEFLIGRLLDNNLLNLDMRDETKEALEEFGFDLESLCEQERDAGLGNGGLGRLAACFLDSMTTLKIPAHGYSIRYDYGIFNQKIVDGRQIELPDDWLKFGYPWEFERPEYTVKIQFYGNVETREEPDGRSVVKWVNSEDILAVPFDVLISGYNNNIVNTLRLWSARGTEEFNLDYFHHGDYRRAVQDKILSENISKVLYPNENISQGKELRLKQEYFFTAASISDIIRRFKEDNDDFRNFSKKVAIQLNDTHPAIAIAELMRILIDRENLLWNDAWDITVKTFAYTNHTTMPEALEIWPVSLFEKLLPRHLQIIYDINSRFLKQVEQRFPLDLDKLKRMSIIEEGEEKRIRMAYLSVVGCHSVNGVSQLHSHLLKTEIFKEFCSFFPNKFNNKTNGVTQRRWLLKANKGLAALLTETVGDEWITNLYALEKLLAFKDELSFQNKWRRIKAENKKFFAKYVKDNMNIDINPESMFDVQVKRIHEYKRQLLFAFYIISQYLKMKDNPGVDITPRTFIIGGKAAPGYFMAKLIIKFINNVGRIVNNDKNVKDRLKVLFVENYRVSLAEKIFPASDLSEQISMAGTEGSGTGCMKFMMNGALTIGTLDGANIEMAEAMGRENMFSFGLNANEIKETRIKGYNPQEMINRSPVLREIIELIRNNYFSVGEPDIFMPILESLRSYDPYFILADFDSYVLKQDEVSGLFRDRTVWTKKSIINVAKSGKFSSDRTVREYAENIWHIPVK